MNKAIKRFIFTSMTAIFILLTVLLALINVINFTMAADDADRITESISRRSGVMDQDNVQKPQNGFPMERFGPMGPDSPDVNDSIRYFTVKISKDGEAQTVAYRMSAVSEEDAIEWAKSLSSQKTGWTHGTYRYRVYKAQKDIFVTVIDQGRELLPSYRILLISLIGEIVCLAVSFAVLWFFARKFFAPIEEADRKQRNFIAEAENEFKLPLTVINADTEIIEIDSGATEQTRSIRRQVRKMGDLVKKLGAFAIMDEGKMQKSVCDLSAVVSRALDDAAKSFEEKGIAVSRDVEEGVRVTADPDAMENVVRELVENVLKFALTKATFSLRRRNDRVTLTVSNDAELPDQSAEAVFDRFTRLDNAKGKEGSGLGLSFVKDAIRAHDGRVAASVADSTFTVRIDL